MGERCCEAESFTSEHPETPESLSAAHRALGWIKSCLDADLHHTPHPCEAAAAAGFLLPPVSLVQMRIFDFNASVSPQESPHFTMKTSFKVNAI